MGCLKLSAAPPPAKCHVHQTDRVYFSFIVLCALQQTAPHFIHEVITEYLHVVDAPKLLERKKTDENVYMTEIKILMVVKKI